MKEKIKEWIFIGFVFLATLICILAISTYNNAVRYIEFTSYPSKLDELVELENDLEYLEDNECTTEIREWIDYYKEINDFYTIIKVSDFFDETPYRPSQLATKKCIDDEEIYKKHAGSIMFSGSILVDGTIWEYYNQYYLTISDQDTVSPDTKYIKYSLHKSSVLELIKDMIVYEKQRSVVTDDQE